MIDSPSYTLNHEEVAKALEEGVRFAECLSPEDGRVDEYGHAVRAARSRSFESDPETGQAGATGETVTLPARTILVAAGTQPNTVLAREDATMSCSTARYFQAVDEEGQPVKPERVAKPAKSRVLMSLRPDGRGDQLLRRPASVVLRQRREGDGQRQAGLSGCVAHAASKRSRRPLPRARSSSA